MSKPFYVKVTKVSCVCVKASVCKMHLRVNASACKSVRGVKASDCKRVWCVKAFVCKSVCVTKCLCVSVSVLCVNAPMCENVCVQRCLHVEVSVYKGLRVYQGLCKILLSPLCFSGPVFSSSHLHIYIYHLHIFTSAHIIVTSPQLLKSTSAHLHISSAHLHIFTSPVSLPLSLSLPRSLLLSHL